MIKQITTILGCALLGFGLACGNDAEGDTCRTVADIPGDSEGFACGNDAEGDTCRTVADIPGNSEGFACGESTPCETLPAGSAYGTCSSIDGCTKQGEPIEIPGKTITVYLCTGTPPAE